MRWLFLLLAAAAIGTGTYAIQPRLFELHTPRTGPAGQSETDENPSPRIFAGGVVEGVRPEIAMRFEIAGRLKEVLVQPGDRVARGDVLAQLEPEAWELKFTEARTLLRLARSERDRLVKSTTAPARAAHPATRTSDEDLAIADSKVALAEGALQRERLMLEKTLLVAPIDGLVLRVLAEPGELVGPNDARDFITLVNRDRTRVRAYVEELDALKVAVGQPAQVFADGIPDKPYTGVVRFCTPFVGPKSHRHLEPGELIDVRVREVLIELAEGADLLTGLPVDVFIETGLVASGPAIDGSVDSPAENGRPIAAGTRPAAAGKPVRTPIGDPHVTAADHRSLPARK